MSVRLDRNAQLSKSLTTHFAVARYSVYPDITPALQWDGIDRQGEAVDFDDFEEVGQLALQIDKTRGKGSAYRPHRDGGYVNTTLVKMIELLKLQVKGFPTAR